MCFDADSVPPIPAISGAAVSHDDLTLEAADGNRFAAFRAMPEGPAPTGIVILPDVRGLYRFYEELALRFAERGFVAVAVRHVRALGCTSICTVGVCFGGRNSWLAAASGHGLKGAVGFYGNPGE